MSEPRFYIVDIDTSHYLYQWMPDWYGVVDDTKGKFGVGQIIAYFADRQQAESFLDDLIAKDQVTTEQATRILLANDKLVDVDECGYGTVQCSLGLRELIGVGQKGLIQALSLAGTGSPNIIDAAYSVTHTDGDRIYFRLSGNLNQCR